jgi:hypothetical protein
MDNQKADARKDKEKAKEFVRSILANDFKQKVDDALVDGVADRVLRALPARER